MTMVAVVGAGDVGGALAHRLAADATAREVRLVDPTSSVASGKALDLQQAGAVERFDTHVVGGRDLHLALGADVVMLADPARHPSGDWPPDAAREILETLAAVNRRAVFICAGSTQRALVEWGAGLAAPQLLGSAPYALATALRAVLGLEFRCSAREVTLTVLGRPPEGLLIPWTHASVRGVSIPDLLAPPALARLQRKAELVWPPGPYGLAAAAARICRSVLRGTGETGFPCYVVLDPTRRPRQAVVRMVALDTTGVSRVYEPSLSAHERVRLESLIALPR